MIDDLVVGEENPPPANQHAELLSDHRGTKLDLQLINERPSPRTRLAGAPAPSSIPLKTLISNNVQLVP